MTPILTVVCACAAPAARTTASAVEPMRRFIPFLLLARAPRGGTLSSHTQVVMQLVDVGLQVRIGEPIDHPAVLHDIVAVRDCRGEPEILLHEQNGESARLQRADGPADLLDD